MKINLSRSVFVEMLAIFNIKNEANAIKSSADWLAAKLGKVKTLFHIEASSRYGDDIWNEIASKEEQIRKKGLDRNKRSLFVSYNVASRIAEALGIDSMREWNRLHKDYFSKYKIPIPSSPHLTYKDKEWEGWGEFLGTGRTQDYNFLPYKEAKALVETLGIQTTKQFKEFVHSPIADPRFPKRPDHVYADVWVGWVDFLAPKFVTYDEAREILKPLKLCSENDFRVLGKENLRPEGIPSHPSVYYAESFISWAHFLGWDDEIERDVYSRERSKRAVNH